MMPMNYMELTSEKLFEELSYAGRYPQPALIDAICERREETEPLVLDLFREAYHDAWLDDEDPRWYRFMHAGKFLLSWRVVEALPTFAELFADDDMQNWVEWYEEDLFHFGPPAIPHLARVFTMESDHKWHYGRALAGSTLTRIATYYPDTRDEIIAILNSQLPSLEDARALGDIDDMWSSVAHELGSLADESSRDTVLALDDADLIYDDFFERQTYLRELKRGFRAKTPPPPYDISSDYRQRYKYHQENLEREAQEKKRQQEERIRKAQIRTGPKIGRNEPCPCGSGKKYKQCHGRPGSTVADL